MREWRDCAAKTFAAFIILLSVLHWIQLQHQFGTQLQSSAVVATVPIIQYPLTKSFSLGFQERGGVVIFYHIPRTGGTSIREVLLRYQNQTTVISGSGSRYKKIIIQRVVTRRRMMLMEKRMEDILHGRFRQSVSKEDEEDDNNDGDNDTLVEEEEGDSVPPQIFFFELHGTLPGISELHSKLQAWRRLAVENNIPFFAFTVLREPTAFAISYFQHFRSVNCSWNWCELDVYETMTQDNLLQSVIPHHQCQILMHGQRENKKRFPTIPLLTSPETEKQCRDQVRHHLDMDWNWVGTTEALQTVTLPLLASLLFQNDTKQPQQQQLQSKTSFNIGKYRRAATVGGHPMMSRETLHEQTKAVLKEKFRVDYQLYERYHAIRWQKS